MRRYNTPDSPVNGLYINLLNQTHVLIAGATGSGKSVVINGIITAALHFTPNQKKFILIDPKRVELSPYRKLPHTVLYASEPPDITSTINYTVNLMENRYKRIQKAGLRQSNNTPIYVIIDEFADLMTTQKADVLKPLCRIAQLGRAANIHLIIATQRPTRDIINGQIKVNIDSRLALRCPTAQDSRNVIGVSGAETLPRYGEGLYYTPDFTEPCKVKIKKVDDAEIDSLIQYWYKQVHPIKSLFRR